MENRDGKDQVVIVAFDYMRVKIGDIAKVEAFKPALMKLFEEKEKENEKET
jgi:ribonuclease Z